MITQATIKLSQTEIQYLHANQLSSESDDNKVMVLLHGWPENSWSWESYLAELSQEYDLYAPDLPGFNGSQGFENVSDYAILKLVETMAEFIKTVAKGRKVHLVAHDWGGVIAWPMVAFHADLFEKLTIMNAAHPATFTREMATNPKQQANSDYISDLISDKAFSITSANDHEMLKRLYGGWYKKLSERQQSALLNQWSDQISMMQGFAYYKNMPQLKTQRVSVNAEIKIPNIFIKIPTQVLWGLNDTAFVPEVLNGMDQWVNDLVLYTFDDADHWLHHQKCKEVKSRLRAFHQ